MNPSKIKRRLAGNLCDQYHGAGAGVGAEAAFDRIFVDKGRPEAVEEHQLVAREDGYWLVSLIAESGLAPSRKEARRLLQQGGVTVDDEKITDEKYRLPACSGSRHLLRVGKRRFLTIVID